MHIPLISLETCRTSNCREPQGHRKQVSGKKERLDKQKVSAQAIWYGVFIDGMTKGTGASVFQVILLRLVFAIASRACRDRSDKEPGAQDVGCVCHAAWYGLHVKTRCRLLLSVAKCALSCVRLRMFHIASSRVLYMQLRAPASFEGNDLVGTWVLHWWGSTA
jgi:hypothetical protein